MRRDVVDKIKLWGYMLKGKLYPNTMFKKYHLLRENDLKRIADDAISQKTPMLWGKLGGSELFLLQSYLLKYKFSKAASQLCLWSGFFPNNRQLLSSYAELMKEIMREIDILCILEKRPAESYFIDTYMKKVQGITKYLAPWAMDIPFTAAFEGKKVLVISPFCKSIKKQYEKRETLFPDRQVLPEFELILMNAVQTIAGNNDARFSNWFEALEYMCREMDGMDYDIALIGCGAYGLPLAAHAKKMGKIGIHLGGDLQMMFGIRGKRWDQMPNAQKVINKYWIYPSEEETPKNHEMVENGCYW